MILIFLILISYSLALIPEWNLNTSGKNVLLTTDKYQYTVFSKNIFPEKLEMIKRIEKSDTGEINLKNIIIFEGKEIPVDFDNIQSYHYAFGHYIICPYGKHHPYHIMNKTYLIPDGAQKDDDWDLKCYYNQFTRIFFAGYSRKNQYNFFYTINDKFFFESLSFSEELYDFKLDDKSLTEKKIPTLSYTKKNKKLYISDSSLDIDKKSNKNSHNYENSHELIDLTLPNTKGFMKDNTNDFYFITYNNTKLFYTGYIQASIYDNFILENTNKKINYSSPFDFEEDLEIKEINFILRNKFIYYKLQKPNENIFYHGIIDIELNKVIFNTKETINSFTPFSDKAMLAITPTAAYIICAYNNGENCTDFCPEEYIIDTSGNYCGSSCPNGQYRFIPNETCVENCEQTKYILIGNKCGLCKDIDKNNPYKFINGLNCLNNKPEGAIFYDKDLLLLKCDENNNYFYENERCVKKNICYEKCDECIEESNNELNQKCTKCKDGFVLEGENCLEHCSEHFYVNQKKCSECAPSCKSCLYNKDNCTSCNGSAFLLDGNCKPCDTKCNKTEEKSCKCLSCVEGYFSKNGVCDKCPDNCLYCNSDTYCNKCISGYFLDNNSNTCIKCHNNCETCFSSYFNDQEQKCLTCKNPKYFFYESNCINECPQGLFGDTKNKKCIKCNEHCKACDEEEEQNNEHCSSCEINSEYRYLIDASGFGKNCVNKCPNGTILKNEKCILNYQNIKNENYSVIIISSSVAGGIVIIVGVLLIIYFCYIKRKKKLEEEVENNIVENEDEDDNELMKNMGEEMEHL